MIAYTNPMPFITHNGLWIPLVDEYFEYLNPLAEPYFPIPIEMEIVDEWDIDNIYYDIYLNPLAEPYMPKEKEKEKEEETKEEYIQHLLEALPEDLY